MASRSQYLWLDRSLKPDFSLDLCEVFPVEFMVSVTHFGLYWTKYYVHVINLVHTLFQTGQLSEVWVSQWEWISQSELFFSSHSVSKHQDCQNALPHHVTLDYKPPPHNLEVTTQWNYKDHSFSYTNFKEIILSRPNEKLSTTWTRNCP